MPERIAVVIPTRNRPEKLARCLAALAVAREQQPFLAYVCDSSDDERHARVAEAVAAHPWAVLHRHDGTNVAMARNVAGRVAEGELLVSVDDDIQVRPDAVAAIVRRYDAAEGPRVVGGSVAWDVWWSAPLKLLPLGFARRIRPGEEPDFLNGAFFLYPKAFAVTWPFNERVRVTEDVIMSATWKAAGVQLLWEADARAVHDPETVTYGLRDQADTIYANLFIAMVADPDRRRAAAFEVLGFLSAARAFVRRPEDLRALVAAWADGHRRFRRDRAWLREQVSKPLPMCP
jgi:glycosyltransferase involved in cell wall biosynthesis